ncbi:MAG: hypothetical protein JNM61_05740 [Zoogloeaceae bacterium]|nr:hypothetical protein [Zoogloeaceae bacterium]
MKAGAAECWCARLPKLRVIPGEVGASCMCGECLAQKIQVSNFGIPG